MAIVKKPKGRPKDDPMTFIEDAGRVEPEPARRKRKEPVVIRFDADMLEQVDRAAARRGLSRASLVRLLVSENLPD
jgi:uncharacterized protein (DUF4415 family)